MRNLENQVLTELKKPKGPKKKRVTFFLSEEVKDALARWCEHNGVKESRAIEEMIKATVPERFFRRKD